MTGTVYSQQYSWSRFRSLRRGMTDREVEAIVGPPLKKVPWAQYMGIHDESMWYYSDQPTITSNFWRRWVHFHDGKVTDIFSDFWSGSSGRFPPLSPPRSGRAQFRHPARHVAESLSLTRSGCLTVTRVEVQCPRCGSGVQSTTRCPLRSTGSGRAHSPASLLLRSTPTPIRESGHDNR
jgi:hypothetical protein